MRTDFWFDSCGAGKIHCCKWTPEGEPKAVLQIIHGIAEFVERYDTFANYLTEQGYVVVAEDHMGHGQSINGDGIQGYFHGGWFNAVADSYKLLQDTRAEYPGVLDAVVDLEAKCVTVTGDADIAAIKKAIEAEDFEVVE